MKFAFLAASALALSIPAFAQDGATTPPPAQDTMQTQDGTMTEDPAMQTPPADAPMAPPPAADPAAPMAPPPAADPAMPAPAAEPMAPAAPGGTMTDGGYAPSAPPMAGPAGGQVVFRPSMPVAQAFPPPPPKAEYPVCRGAVTDGCRNPGDK